MVNFYADSPPPLRPRGRQVPEVPEVPEEGATDGLAAVEEDPGEVPQKAPRQKKPRADATEVFEIAE